MMKKKRYKSVNESGSVNEPQLSYNNRVTITTLAALEERDRELTRNMSHEQRMEYLQKLISITYGQDLSKQERAFYNGKFTIRKGQ